MANISLDGKADAALSKLQDTTLTPMEEALFQGWAKANQIAKPDAPEDRIDYRGIYKHTGGMILPYGQLKRFADKLNSEEDLQRILHERMMQHIEKAKGAGMQNENKEPQASDKNSPAEHHSYKLQNEGTELQTEGTAKQNEGIALQNEGKKLDIEKLMVQREMNKEKPEPKKEHN